MINYNIVNLNAHLSNLDINEIIFDPKILNNNIMSKTKSFVNVYDDDNNVVTTITNNTKLFVLEERLESSVVYIDKIKYFGIIHHKNTKNCIRLSDKKVTALATMCFEEPCIKSKVKYFSYLNDEIPLIIDECEKFYHTNDGFFIKSHFNTNHKSISDVASMFINTPYLWGGLGHYGIDCSGLVQNCFKSIGIPMQRDAFQQEKNINFKPINEDEIQKDTVVFWPGHVGIMINKTNIIHANATSMDVRIEPYSFVKKNIKKLEKNSPSSFMEYINEQ